MTLIRWTAKLELGIEEIDRQHQALIGAVNRIYDSLSAGCERDVLAAIIEELERLTAQHFATEDRLMDAHAYADAAAHKAEHRTMLADVQRYCDECVLGSTSPKVVLGYLEHWFLPHLDDADRRLAAALAAAAEA